TGNRIRIGLEKALEHAALSPQSPNSRQSAPHLQTHAVQSLQFAVMLARALQSCHHVVVRRHHPAPAEVAESLRGERPYRQSRQSEFGRDKCQ
ncbi:MAG TPA: hypothetical protein VL425_10430, partial [Rudaea sp.]|nr:hypothetical protein [Rudaea sp.]